MSVESYFEWGAEVQTTQEEKNFQKKVNEAIADWKIEESELLWLQELYEAEKDNIKESFVDARRNELIQVIANNLVYQNPEGEFENEFEGTDSDAIQIDSDILAWRLIDKDTFFNSEYAEIAEKFGITSTEVLNAISTMAPDRVELDTIWNIKNSIKEWAEYVADKTVERAEYVADSTRELVDEAIVATAKALDPSAAKERLAKRNESENKIKPLTQEHSKDETSEKKPENKKYTVVKWDNLTKIAKRNKVELKDLINANKSIKEINKIKIGQKIIIPKQKK